MSILRPVALVTGASSGIGLALARQLAAQDHDLVLVARNEAALARIGHEIAEASGVGVHPIAADLAQPGAVAKLAQVLKRRRLEIDVLVNNAGATIGGAFQVTDQDAALRLVRLQVDATLELTALVLPMMQRRGRGRILNVASLYAFVPVPRQAVYGACKAFMYSFSAALREELRGTPITVTLLAPGPTKTDLRRRAGLAHLSHSAGASPDAVAAAGLRGTFRGQFLVLPGLRNRLFVAFVRSLPISGAVRMMGWINRIRGV